jgi:hypothetical protein
VDNKVQVSYSVKFRGATDQSLGESRGSCWETELSSCVARAVHDTKLASKKVR